MTLRVADLCAADRQTRTQSALNALVAHYSQSPIQQVLIDGLFVNRGNGAGWLTGISELSVSFCLGRPVKIRALSEVLQKHRIDQSLAIRGMQWGEEMLQTISLCGSDSYGISLFREIYETVYLRNPTESSLPFRFGIAFELGGKSPTLKVYFDLYATKAEHRRDTLDQIAGLVGETPGLEAWKRACPGTNIDAIRVIGVDFGAGDTVRTKFYWGTRRLTWADITTASRQISGDRHTETLHHLESEFIGVSDALSSLLISMCSSNGERSMKLDLCVARLYKNDGDAYDAIERFRRQVMDGVGPTPFELITGGLEPHQTKCVQQYLGVELPPSQSSRITIYYRLVGLETEHLNPALRPRMCA